MATDQTKALSIKGKHEVGTLLSSQIRTVPQGAIATVATDNYTIVELGFDKEGNRTFKPLSDKTKKGHLLAAVEVLNLGESMSNFFVDVDESARVVIQDEGIQIETSAFELDSTVSAIEVGLVGHYDVTKKKVVLSKVGAEHADYATAGNKYLVVGDESHVERWLGKPTIKLEVL